VKIFQKYFINYNVVRVNKILFNSLALLLFDYTLFSK